jgi:hypothetical protein
VNDYCSACVCESVYIICNPHHLGPIVKAAFLRLLPAIVVRLPFAKIAVSLLIGLAFRIFGFVFALLLVSSAVGGDGFLAYGLMAAGFESNTLLGDGFTGSFNDSNSVGSNWSHTSFASVAGRATHRCPC